ncbi:MAG: tRNA-guanine transglycosylase, partial [Actinomycetota bacterium]|nr:tRNA-guanine transglycosylase [Actinomycetota bacterium]
PLHASCHCFTCRHYSRGYLRHLHVTDELLAYRLLSIHNLRYTLELLGEARAALLTGAFQAFHQEVVGRRSLDG